MLSGLEVVKIAVAYDLDEGRTTNLPYDLSALARAVPIYEVLPGWSADISGARRMSDLPAEARQYINQIQEIVGAPITAIGVGPARDQVILP